MHGLDKQESKAASWKIFFKDLNFDEIQIDEFWSFVFKKEKNLTQIEKISETMGDFWTFTVVHPISKLLFAHISGKRITENAIKLLRLIKKRLLTKIFYLTTDGHDMYIDALNSVYGNLNNGVINFPDGLCYAQVIKDFEKNKCTGVRKKIILGTPEEIENYLAKSEVSVQINTSFIERTNLTFRQHNKRIERRTQGFSKLTGYFKHQINLTISYYNFCLPHLSLQRSDGDRIVHYTPAMAAGITDDVWNFRRILNFPVN